MGKGSNRRPPAVPDTEWRQNFDRIFPPKQTPANVEARHPLSEGISSHIHWVRSTFDGTHRRVIDLTVDGKFRCICVDCWRSWPEGGEYPPSCEPE